MLDFFVQSFFQRKSVAKCREPRLGLGAGVFLCYGDRDADMAL